MDDRICARCGNLGREHLLAFDSEDRIVAASYPDAMTFIVCATGEDAYREPREERQAFERLRYQVHLMNEERR